MKFHIRHIFRDGVNYYEIVDSTVECIVSVHTSYFEAQSQFTKMYVGISEMKKEVNGIMEEAKVEMQKYIEELHIEYRKGISEIDE